MKRGGWFKRKLRFRSTLMSWYLLIILFAFLFIPVIFPLASLVFMVTDMAIQKEEYADLKYGNASQLKNNWHQEAAQLGGNSPEQIDVRLQELYEKYPEASLFWVDADGYTHLQHAEQQLSLPDRWTHADAIRFMKDNVDSDPYTVVAFIGANNEGPAFMVIQMPRSLLELDTPIGIGTPFYIAFIFMMFGLFILMSLLFFRHIRKRLLRLQAAMMQHDSNGLPMPIVQKKQDEIGQLEATFNLMVDQLRESQQRQREEEELRKRLISNLSHDLRTPLTVVNSHIYALSKEDGLSERGQESIRQLEKKVEGLSSLIENLLSYTLMASGRYPIKLESVDVSRLVRESAAAWYPLWEREGIEAEVRVSGQSLVWQVDKEGFRRILDNLFQNIVRHASQGGYIGISLEPWKESVALVISDRGEGVDAVSNGKGAGIGLAIVDYLIREMGLGWDMHSSEYGTKVYIYKTG